MMGVSVSNSLVRLQAQRCACLCHVFDYDDAAGVDECQVCLAVVECRCRLRGGAHASPGLGLHPTLGWTCVLT
jgi:hypothetical protein